MRSKAQTSKGYGFVKFHAVNQAVEAIRTFDGYIWDSYQLEVKFADQDAGPPSSGNHTVVNAFALHMQCPIVLP